MSGHSQIFVLDDKLVAVFSVTMNHCVGEFECLLSKNGIEDFTVQYIGTNSDRKTLIELGKIEATRLIDEYWNTPLDSAK
ncbi:MULTISPECIES: hypothetical protein [Bacillus]|uniref:Uncharacterized protein n=2 Tax=Bacillus TaxID=1386 RepID=A0A0M4FRL5_9BACI|nr:MULTISPECIES: hypothetical protein [Bacillus]ALC82210.1 hypothetical protein AM592_11940 [Bacillus gobiensis]MBP1081050.1 hypothetical protein [Bacillus capparidis]MED1095742.1 hypothetical protein [Bacillus capparidis]